MFYQQNLQGLQGEKQQMLDKLNTFNMQRQEVLFTEEKWGCKQMTYNCFESVCDSVCKMPKTNILPDIIIYFQILPIKGFIFCIFLLCDLNLLNC